MVCVIGPQQSYKAEMVGAAIGTAVALNGDRQQIDNKAVTECATTPPHKECSDMDMRLNIYANTSHKPWNGSQATGTSLTPPSRWSEKISVATTKWTSLPKWRHHCRYLTMTRKSLWI